MNVPLLNIEKINELILEKRKEYDKAESPHDKLVARCYIDAYQTVLVEHNIPLERK